MNKRELERVKRERLDQMLKANPKLDEVITNMVNGENPTMEATVEAVIKDRLEQARQQGIETGAYGYCLAAVERLSKFESLDEARQWYAGEAERLKKKLGLV